MRPVISLAFALAVVPAAAGAYPLYGSEDSGIGRLEEARLAHEGVIKGKKKLPGELLRIDQVDLRLIDRKDLELPAPDPAFTSEIVAMLGPDAPRYSVSVLDLSDPESIAYAEYNGHEGRNPGSVGKILVATGLFQTLADVYPDSIEKRLEVLRDTIITADEFIIQDSHTVRMWDPETRALTRRALQVGDRGSLYTFLDWMMSPSSNAAAATLQKHAMLLGHFGKAYPVPFDQGVMFFKVTPKPELTALFGRVMADPITRNGLDFDELRQGSFFTRTGKAKVTGTGNSIATTHALMNWLLRLEQGRIVDEFSSREIKRLLYVTERRIRYASSPVLHDSAVYFKSGSWYGCEPEPGFVCKKYAGNKRNLMNSVAIVESPAGAPRLYYMVALTSNVLRKNSAVDHQSLATRIQRLMEKRHKTTAASQ